MPSSSRKKSSRAAPPAKRSTKARPARKPAARAPPKKAAPRPSPAARKPVKKPAAPAPKASLKSAASRAPTPAPTVLPPVRGPAGRRHVLSLSFLRDGDEFLARIETDAGSITEFKHRVLDQLLSLVASELEDLLE